MHSLIGDPIPFIVLADSAYPDSRYLKRVLGGNSPEACLLSALRCPVEHW
jgi:hypothetical protein